MKFMKVIKIMRAMKILSLMKIMKINNLGQPSNAYENYQPLYYESYQSALQRFLDISITTLITVISKKSRTFSVPNRGL